MARIDYNIIVRGKSKLTEQQERTESKMTTLDKRALESYERWYLEPLEPVDWETEEDACWDENRQAVRGEAEGVVAGVLSPTTIRRYGKRSERGSMGPGIRF